MNLASGIRILMVTDDLVGVLNKTLTAVIEAHDVFARNSLFPGVLRMDTSAMKDLGELAFENFWEQATHQGIRRW